MAAVGRPGRILVGGVVRRDDALLARRGIHDGELELAAGQRLVGFALETSNEVAHATEKLERKNLDFIVLNSLKDKGAGFRCDTNKVSILEANGKLTEYPVKPKNEVAGDIVEKLASLLK